MDGTGKDEKRTDRKNIYIYIYKFSTMNALFGLYKWAHLIIPNNSLYPSVVLLKDFLKYECW